MALVTKKKKTPASNVTQKIQETHTPKEPVSTTSGTVSTKTAMVAAGKPQVPVKRVPAVRKPAIPKQEEVKPDVPKEEPKVKRAERPSPEAKEPIIASKSLSDTAEPRPATKGAERVSTEHMRQMTLEERYKLWKKLNPILEKFIPIRKELPKKMEMRKDEAILRNIVPSTAPRVKNFRVGYCPYCVDYQVFHTHSWTGYDKCIGCGITTKDFYVGIDNGIFGKE